MPEFHYQDPFPLRNDTTEYRLLTKKFVSITTFEGSEILKIDPEGLSLLSNEAIRDISFLMRAKHLEKVAKILDDPESSPNDRGVALALLRNADVSSHFILPLCQDTGTATIVAKKGSQVWTGVHDEEYLSLGIYKAYTEENLRYSQSMPISIYEEVNSGTNLPAQIDIYETLGQEYKFLFVTKGGGSANKSLLFQETKALLNPERLEKYLTEKMKTLGTSACPPYHLVFVIGGTSAEACLKTVKLASAGDLDDLPTQGNKFGQAFRDLELEEKMLKAAQNTGIGAQFGGKYFALDVKIIRLPRHGASCPVGVGVSCSADRNARAKINRDGIWLEVMERNPVRLIPEKYRGKTRETGVVKINLNRPMKEILAELSKHLVTTRLALTGTLIVARDIAHAKIKERIDHGKGMPEYFKNHPIYYAGPAKTPTGLPSGSFGPTTAGRMDSYVEPFQAMGGSMIMMAKGNRGPAVTQACKKYGGFYLGSIGGPAALLAQENIRKVVLLEYPELGMEAIYKIEVEDFPAFILVDDKGNDFYAQIGAIAKME
ncbi:MAG: fumarate hydratase [Deltaproteobacteria bacterium]|nr:fumarate hydratase [Deltaproteobacteria bacterium]